MERFYNIYPAHKYRYSTGMALAAVMVIKGISQGPRRHQHLAKSEMGRTPPITESRRGIPVVYYRSPFLPIIPSYRILKLQPGRLSVKLPTVPVPPVVGGAKPNQRE